MFFLYHDGIFGKLVYNYFVWRFLLSEILSVLNATFGSYQLHCRKQRLLVEA